MSFEILLVTDEPRLLIALTNLFIGARTKFKPLPTEPRDSKKPRPAASIRPCWM